MVICTRSILMIILLFICVNLNARKINNARTVLRNPYLQNAPNSSANNFGLNIIGSAESCSVNVDLACQVEFFNGQAETITWTSNTAVGRTRLFTNIEVQKNIQGCFNFADLIKAECQPHEPVMAIHTDVEGYKTTYFSTSVKSRMSNDSEVLKLKSFSEYFVSAP